jgi:hypothetical protein
MNAGNNYGVLAIDWDRTDPLIRLQIRDEQGEVTIQEKVPLSLLQPGALKGKAGARARLSTGEILTAEVVAKHLTRKCTVELEVRGTGASKTLLFLNSEADRSDEANFTVVIPRKLEEAFQKAGIADPRRHYEGRAIRVTGVLSTFREQPQIMVTGPADIELVQKQGAGK